MNWRTLFLGIGLSFFGGAAIQPAMALQCTNCPGDPNDYEDGKGEAPVLPSKPICTVVCKLTSDAATACYEYKSPTEFTLTNCGKFGITKATGSGGKAFGTAILQTCSTTAPVVKSFSKSISRSETFGGSFMGASYSLSGTLSGKDKSVAGTAGDVVELSGNASAKATLFSINKTLATLAGNAKTIEGVSASGSLSANVLGVSVWSQSWSAPLSVNKVFTKTFISATYPVQLGIYTVSVSGKVTGEARVKASGGPTTTGLSGVFTPSVKAYASATAGVSVFGVGAGVEGSLTMLEVSVPVNATGNFFAGTLSWKLNVDLALKALAGSLKLIVFVPLLPDPSWTIFSWTGFSKTWNLFSEAGCTKLQ